MRHRNILRFVLLAAILLTLGCSSNNKGKIEGTKWTSLAANVKGLAVPAGGLKLEFGTDKTLHYIVAGQDLKGTYSLGSGDTVVMNFEKDLAGRKVHRQTVVINGENLPLIDSDGTQITFSKVK